MKITQRKLKAIFNDNEKTAKAINLMYVNDAQPGIRRIRKGDKFIYKMGNSTITKKDDLLRINKLVIPPAWENVWICAEPNGHLQVTGIDALGRKQYKYHPLWNSLRNHTKFSNLHAFGLALPGIREKLKKHLALPGLPIEKVMAAAISVMECTCMRIGNNAYEKLYGSFGLTTLKDKHVTISGSELKFSFKGKKGIYHNIGLKNKKLARIVQQCRDIPGKELFQYYDEEGQRRAIDSGMVNNYIRDISGGNFTAKDFRTWAGSLQALAAFKEAGQSNSATEAGKKLVAALDVVAKHLGNTRTVCRKYYVHPAIIELFLANKLNRYFMPKAVKPDPDQQGLSGEEQVLMKILEQTSAAVIDQ